MKRILLVLLGCTCLALTSKAQPSINALMERSWQLVTVDSGMAQETDCPTEVNWDRFPSTFTLILQPDSAFELTTNKGTIHQGHWLRDPSLDHTLLLTNAEGRQWAIDVLRLQNDSLTLNLSWITNRYSDPVPCLAITRTCVLLPFSERSWTMPLLVVVALLSVLIFLAIRDLNRHRDNDQIYQ